MRIETHGCIFRSVLRGAGFLVLLLVLNSSARAHYTLRSDFDDPVRPPTPAQTPSSDEATEKAGGEFITVVEELAKEAPKPKTAAGPPSKQDRLQEEASIQAMYLKAQLEQAQQARKRAENATNPAERQVLLKDAQVKSENAASLTRSIVGPPAQGNTAQTESAAQDGNSPARGNLQLKQTWGVLEQLKQSNYESTEAAKSKSVNEAKGRAAEAFKDGRAGAGGVALYKAATMLTPLDRSKMGTALVENDRLVLMYDGQKLLFPKVDTQFLALAIRSVYGGEGLVKGKLLANEKNAVVISTGKEQYGDVVWKKEFLPDLPENLTPGEELALELGPGVGVLSLPEPSHDRVTYYGPLKGNILGQVVQESDMVFSMYWYGVDWKTGKPIDPTKLDGYESSIENDLKQTGDPDAQMTRTREPAKNWWEDTVWFVWTPDEISLQLASESNEFEFVKASMKANVWGVREENVFPSSRIEGEYLSRNYDEFARAFPVLARLKEAAKAVALVRWLKQNKVPLTLEWARSYPLTVVNTPDDIRRFSVYVHRDKTGKPLVETPQ